jgi:hypothetical protein
MVYISLGFFLTKTNKQVLNMVIQNSNNNKYNYYLILYAIEILNEKLHIYKESFWVKLKINILKHIQKLLYTFFQLDQ